MKTTFSQSTAAQNLRPNHTKTSGSYYGAQEASASGSYLPEFLRLPRAGSRDPHFSLSRSMWNQLILPCEANGYRPPIKSFSLRRKGTLKGVRIISAPSALDYFRKLEAEQNPPTSPECPQGTGTLSETITVGNETPPDPRGFNNQIQTKSHPRVA